MEAAAYTLKRAALEEEFRELSEESEGMLRELHEMNAIKQRLQAEVSFLQGRARLIKESTRNTEGIKEFFPVGESVVEHTYNATLTMPMRSFPSKSRLPRKQGFAVNQTMVCDELRGGVSKLSKYANNGFLSKS